MPSHTAIKRPRPPTVRRYSRTSANAKDSHSTSRPDKRRRIRCANSIALPPENSQRHSNHAPTNAGEPHNPAHRAPTSAWNPHNPAHRASDKRRRTPTAQHIAPRQAPECRGIPSGRHGHFFKQKILPALWLKGFCIVYLYPLGNCRSSPRTAILGPLSICALQLSGFLPSCA